MTRKAIEEIWQAEAEAKAVVEASQGQSLTRLAEAGEAAGARRERVLAEASARGLEQLERTRARAEEQAAALRAEAEEQCQVLASRASTRMDEAVALIVERIVSYFGRS